MKKETLHKVIKYFVYTTVFLILFISCGKEDSDSTSSLLLEIVNPLYLADNGVTIKARDNATIGMMQEFEGNVYTIVSENQLRQMIDNSEDITYVVTSKITNFSQLFQEKPVVGDVKRWDVSNVTNMSFMFQFSGFNGNISYWDVSNVTNMRAMFYHLPTYQHYNYTSNELYLSFPYSAIAGAVWAGIFAQSPSLQPILQPWIAQYVGPIGPVPDLGDAIAADVTSYLTSALTDVITQTYESLAAQLGIPFSVVTSGTLASQGVPALETTIASSLDQFLGAIVGGFQPSENLMRGPFNQDISNWNVSNVTDMSYMFYKNDFNQDIFNWNVSNVTGMRYMFGKANNFNQNLSNWDVSGVTDCTGFFIKTFSWTLSKPNFANCNPN